MSFLETPIKSLQFIFLLVIATINIEKSEAAMLSLNWSGQVTSITSFNENAVPASIAIGSEVLGSLVYDLTGYNSSYDVFGFFYGSTYRYPEGLRRTIDIGAWKWAFNGGDISLVRYPLTFQAFDIYTTSENYGYDLFPNYVGRFEYGVAFFDSDYPFGLFGSSAMQKPDLNQMTVANGFLTTRLWDNQDNIIDGYYITFDIDEASFNSVPLPSMLFMFIAGLALILFKTDKRCLQ